VKNWRVVFARARGTAQRTVRAKFSAIILLSWEAHGRTIARPSSARVSDTPEPARAQSRLAPAASRRRNHRGIIQIRRSPKDDMITTALLQRVQILASTVNLFETHPGGWSLVDNKRNTHTANFMETVCVARKDVT